MRKTLVSFVINSRPNPGSPLLHVAIISKAVTVFALLLLGVITPTPLHGQFTPGAIQPYNNAVELFSRADRVYEYGREVRDYNESHRALRTAIPLYREFLRNAPGHEFAQKARYRLGMSLLLTGNLEQAEETFESIIQLYRRGHYVAAAAYRIAAQHYNANKWAKAAPYFKTAAAQADKPDLRHKSLYYQARCLILANQPAAAITTLEGMISDPGNPFRDYARLAVGQIYASRDEHEKALTQFETLISGNTAPQERAQALLAAGVSAAALNDPVRAETYLNNTIDAPGIDQKFKARAQLSLMKLRFEKKDYTATIKQFQRGEFKGEDSTMSEIYMMAGRSFAQLNRHHEAIRYFFNAQRLTTTTTLGFEASYRRLLSFYQIGDPNVPSQVDAFVELYGNQKKQEWIQQAKLMKAESLLHSSSDHRAAAAYQNVDPAGLPEELRPDLYFKRGWALANTNDHNGAVQSLSSFINRFPDHERLAYALAQRGNSFLQLGDRGSAIRDFEQVLTLQPDQKLVAFAQQKTGQIFRENRDYEKLIERYTTFLEDHSDLTTTTKAHANYWIGWAHYKLQDYDQCTSFFEKARDLVPSIYREPATTHLMLAAYSLKDPNLLKKHVDALRKDAPGKTLPLNMLTWLGLQMFQKGDYDSADDYLSLASTPDEPSYTDLIVWRHLAKARVELRHFDRAMEAIPIMIEMEERDFWKADAYLDKSHALIGLKKWDEAREAAHDGLELEPAGAVKAGLHMSLGEIAMNRKDFESAAASFLRTADLFIDDTQIKPRALRRAAEALEAAGETERARAVRQQLGKDLSKATSN